MTRISYVCNIAHVQTFSSVNLDNRPSRLRIALTLQVYIEISALVGLVAGVALLMSGSITQAGVDSIGVDRSIETARAC